MSHDHPSIVVFTDIDGTLIDLETYDHAASAPAVERLVRRGVPVVLCSSKTRAEQEHLHQVLGIPEPFIVENGSAIVVPGGYFAFDLPGRPGGSDHWIVELGADVDRIRSALHGASSRLGLSLQGYADLPLAQVAEITGLDLAAAARAMKREYSETIVTPLSADELAALNRELVRGGLMAVSGGRFHTVTSLDSDKGEAVRVLSQLFQRKLGGIHTAGIGDSANDLPMLAAVDRAYLVQRPDSTWQDVAGLPVARLAGIGPEGWRQFADEIIQLAKGGRN
jgi:mannosyl-3-phosphoglycerate phosphatase family protein